MKLAPTISTLILAFELGAFETLGLDVDRILGLSELSRERIADPRGRLPLEMRFRWWEAALHVSGDPALGLRVGKSMPVGALGSFEYLLRNCASVTEVVDRANEYMRLVDETGVIEVVHDGEIAALRASRSGGYPNTPPEIHCLFAALLLIIQKEWPGARLTSVRLSHPAPKDVDIFERHFACPVRFESEHNEIRFSASLLQLPQARADGNLARVLEEHARHLLAQLPNENPFLQNARGELLKQIDLGNPSAVTLARALRMSERTLRRRLDAEGTSYNALLSEVRQDLARRYVTQTREGFEAIADKLAFADASTFLRAFKRWTGMTPAQFRERAKLG
jgi:AraC-like DNA-binding protein